MAFIDAVMIMFVRGIHGLAVAGLILVLMLLGLIRKEAGFMLFAAFLLVPFAYAMGGWKGVYLLVRLMPLLLLGSSFAISKNDAIFAWSLPVPVFGYLLYILFRIMTTGFTGIEPMYQY